MLSSRIISRSCVLAKATSANIQPRMFITIKSPGKDSKPMPDPVKVNIPLSQPGKQDPIDSKFGWKGLGAVSPRQDILSAEKSGINTQQKRTLQSQAEQCNRSQESKCQTTGGYKQLDFQPEKPGDPFASLDKGKKYSAEAMASKSGPLSEDGDKQFKKHDPSPGKQISGKRNFSTSSANLANPQQKQSFPSNMTDAYGRPESIGGAELGGIFEDEAHTGHPGKGGIKNTPKTDHDERQAPSILKVVDRVKEKLHLGEIKERLHLGEIKEKLHLGKKH